MACNLQIDADPVPDPAYHFDTDPDPDFLFDVDPDFFYADAEPGADPGYQNDADPNADPGPQHCRFCFFDVDRARIMFRSVKRRKKRRV